MASVLDQLDVSNFSLPGNGFDVQPGTAGWGFPDWTYNNGDLEPELSNLHWDYSYLEDPDDVEIQDLTDPHLEETYILVYLHPLLWTKWILLLQAIGKQDKEV